MTPPAQQGGRKAVSNSSAHAKSPKRKRAAEFAAASAANEKKRPKGASIAAKRGGQTSGTKYRQNTDDAKRNLTKKEQRDEARKKKAAKGQKFQIIQEVLQLWERLRPSTTEEGLRTDLVKVILEKVSGRLPEVSMNPVASRVIQTCVKVGSAAQRQQVWAEVRPRLLELSKNKYSVHLVSKMISQATKEGMQGLLRYFRGSVGELLRHPVGSSVIDTLYHKASTAQRNTLVGELYGKEFVLFEGGEDAKRLSSLHELWKTLPAARRMRLIQNLSQQLLPIMEKGLLEPLAVHRLVAEFLQHAPSSSVEDAVDTLSSVNLLRMAHTHPGARVGCMVLAYGAPKDRKRAVKAMKDHVVDMAEDEWAHAVLLTALGCTDDTQLLRKHIVAELTEHAARLCRHKFGSRVFLQLLDPDSTRHVPASILELVHPPRRTLRGGSGLVDLDEDEDEAAALNPSGGGAEGWGGEGDGEGGQEEGDDELFAQAGGGGEEEEEDEDGEQEEGLGVVPDEFLEHAEIGEGEVGAESERAEGGELQERVLGLSKKPAEMRRREVLGRGKGSLSVALAEEVAASIGELMCGSHSWGLVAEVASGGVDGLLSELAPDGITAVHQALAALLAADCAAADGGKGGSAAEQQGNAEEAPSTQGEDGDGDEPVMLQFWASRCLQRLLRYAAERPAAADLARLLWPHISGHCTPWLGSHAEKLLAAFIQCGVAKVADAARREVAPALPAGTNIDQWCHKFSRHAGK